MCSPLKISLQYLLCHASTLSWSSHSEYLLYFPPSQDKALILLLWLISFKTWFIFSLLYLQILGVSQTEVCFLSEPCCLILIKLLNLSKFGFLICTKGMLCQICIWVVLSELTSVEERRKEGLIEPDVTCLAVTIKATASPVGATRLSAGIGAGGPSLYTPSLTNHLVWQLLGSEGDFGWGLSLQLKASSEEGLSEICQHPQPQQLGGNTDVLEWGI